MSGRQRPDLPTTASAEPDGAPVKSDRTEMDTERRVAVLEAIEDVRALLGRYTWALDHADFDGLLACFEEDGTFAFQDQEWQGHEAIRGYFVGDRKSHTEMLHYPVNVVVEVTNLDPGNGGAGLAVASATLWDLFNRRTATGTEGACLAGYYRMTAGRRAGAWRIRRLEVSARWVVPAGEWRMSPEFQPRPEARP
jgi:SnoaL-like domain